MSKNDVTKIISEVTGTKVTPDMGGELLSSFENFDSLAFLRVISELEEAGAELDIEKLDGINTLNDLFNALGV
jgi:acyl carrier protein